MPTKSTTRVSNKNGSTAAKSKVVTKDSVKAAVSVDDLIKQATQILNKNYKVTLSDRKKRITIKVYHALREKMGLDIQAQVRKHNGNFDWQKWNTKVFVLLFGKPESPKYSALTMAKIAAHFYDSISANPDQAVIDLVEFNRQSLERRNSLQQDKEEEIEDVDEEFDDSVLDEDEDDIDDDLDDEDESEIEASLDVDDEDEDFLDEDEEDDELE